MSKNQPAPSNQNIIPYRKGYRAITGSILGALLLQQLEYWFEKMDNKPIYKYLSPPEGAHSWYKPGDSWTEELGVSEAEFRTAYKKIGIHYKSKSLYDEVSDKFRGKLYVSYTDKMSHLTYYIRNGRLVNRALGGLTTLSSDDETIEDAETINVAPEYMNAEITAEITQEITHLSTEGDYDAPNTIYLYSADDDYVIKLVDHLTSLGVPNLKALYPYERDPKHKNYDKRKYFCADQPLTSVPNTAIELVYTYYRCKFGHAEKSYPLASHHVRQIRARLKEYSITKLIHAIYAAKESDIYNGNLRFEGDSSWPGADLTWITKSNENVYKLAFEVFPHLNE